MCRCWLALFFLFVFAPVARSAAQSSPAEESFKKYENCVGTIRKKPSSHSKDFVIQVVTQKDLEKLTFKLKKAIKNGYKIIEVNIASGVYRYDKVPVSLYKVDASEVSISIKGNNTILVAGGKDYRNGSLIASPTRNHIYLDEKRKLIELYGEVMQANGSVEIVDQEEKLCRMAVSQPCEFMSGMRMQLSEWYRSPIYKVTEVRDGFVYFIAHDLKYDKQKKCYNVQYDDAIASFNPRYRFVEIAKAQTYTGKIHECTVSQFVKLHHVKLKAFSVSGIEFCGSAKGDEAFFAFQDVAAEQIDIANCQFEYMKPRVVSLKKTNHFVFQNNMVSNCYAGALYSDADCSKTIVKGNRFYRAEKGWTNSSCVVCYGEDFLISDNTFEDIAYSSIRTGYYYKLGDELVSKGIIENNEIYLGDEYYSHPEKYSLIDGGAIYISTLCNQVIVRYNYIHNYRGVKSNRAIYCDDGAMNVKIYGNVISGITNAHSILSWRAKSINKKFPQSNDGIDFYYNVIWGKYKFDERPGSSCVHGKNLILHAEGETPPENVLKNFAYQEQDCVFSCDSMENGKMKIPSEAMQELKKFPTYEKMKKWLD